MTNSESGWEVRPLSPALGAEVIGPKINNLNDDQVKKLKELLLEHLVIFMPDQCPSPALHVESGKRFGSLEGHVFTIFVIVLAAAEAAVALAIIINLFKNIGTVDVDKAQEMKG